MTDRQAALTAFLAEQLNVDAAEITLHRPLLELGYDSLIQLEVLLFLESTWAIPLQADQVDPEALGTVHGILELASRASS